MHHRKTGLMDWSGRVLQIIRGQVFHYYFSSFFSTRKLDDEILLTILCLRNLIYIFWLPIFEGDILLEMLLTSCYIMQEIWKVQIQNRSIRRRQKIHIPHRSFSEISEWKPEFRNFERTSPACLNNWKFPKYLSFWEINRKSV